MDDAPSISDPLGGWRHSCEAQSRLFRVPDDESCPSCGEPPPRAAILRLERLTRSIRLNDLEKEDLALLLKAFRAAERLASLRPDFTGPAMGGLREAIYAAKRRK